MGKRIYCDDLYGASGETEMFNGVYMNSLCGMSVEDFKNGSPRKVNQVSGCGCDTGDTGDTKTVMVGGGFYVQSKITEITSTDISSFDFAAVKKGEEASFELFLEAEAPIGDEEYGDDAYRERCEKCMVFAIEDGASYVIKDGFGSDATAVFELLDTMQVGSKTYKILVDYSENNAYLPIEPSEGEGESFNYSVEVD